MLGGYFSRRFIGLIGRFSKPPPQFGQMWLNTLVTQLAQNVHSKVQISACVDSFGKSLLQCSQLGLISNIQLILPLK